MGNIYYFSPQVVRHRTRGGFRLVRLKRDAGHQPERSSGNALASVRGLLNAGLISLVMWGMIGVGFGIF